MAITLYSFPAHECFHIGYQATAAEGQNPEIVSRIPMTSPLSCCWRWKVMREMEWDCKQILVHAGLYVVGMAGFALALIWRVVRLVGRIFLLIAAFLKGLLHCEWKEFGDRIVITGISSVKIVNAAVGILCPPVAYWLDDCLDSMMPYHDHTWYLFEIDPDMPHVDEAYAFLGLQEGATKEEVKKAYKAMLLQHHPDKVKTEDATMIGKVLNARKRIEAHLKYPHSSICYA